MAIIYEKDYNGQVIKINDRFSCDPKETYTDATRLNYTVDAEGAAQVYDDYSQMSRLYPMPNHWIIGEGGSAISQSDPWTKALYFDVNENNALTLKIAGNNMSNGLKTQDNYDYVPGWNLWNPDYSSNMQMTFATNLPIFEDEQTAIAYCNETDETVRKNMIMQSAVNYKNAEEEPDTVDLEINNYGVLQIWTSEGQQDTHSTTLIYRCFKIKKTAGEITFYKIPGIDGDSLKYGIKYSNDFEAYYIGYSEDGGNTYTQVDQLPYNFIYRKRENELGRFYASPIDVELDSSNTGIPTWDSEEDADDYLDGNKDITEATNWPTISNNYPITNGTEEGESTTEFGETYIRSVFSQLYMLNSGGLSEISNGLFDVSVNGIWEKIQKGIEMYGTDPMQCVQGLTYYPFDLSSIFTNYADQQYVYFGGYQLQMQNTAKKILFPQGYKDLGTMTIKRSFNDWRDFEPYTKLFVYLPYVGVQQLSLARYYGKTVTVRYYVDIRTAVCMVVLIANGIMLDYFMGQMGVQMPITLTDFASYSANQINTIMQGATSALSAVNPFCGSIAKIGLASASSLYASEQADIKENGSWAKLASHTHDGSKNAIAATVAGEVGAMGLAGGLTAMKTTFELSQNGINGYNKTKGSATSMLNCYLPQYITFMFEIMESDESEYLNELAGKPTNMSGRIGDFSGYLECDDVMLICPIATDAERQEIINLVRAGIYL